jgi:hypothetical protein
MRNPLRRQRTYLVAAAVAALGIAGGCTNPADPTSQRGVGASPAQRPLWDGRWTGQTADGQLVTFTIVGSEITDFSIGIDLASDCHIGIFKAVITDAADAVGDQQIVVGDSTSPISLRGEFTGDAAAAGSVVVNYAGTSNGTMCNAHGGATWRASRNW